METLAIKALTGGGGSGGNLIDDTATSTTKTWSSSKLNEDIANKITNPNGGTAGQVLTKTANGEAWQSSSINPEEYTETHSVFITANDYHTEEDRIAVFDGSGHLKDSGIEYDDVILKKSGTTSDNVTVFTTGGDIKDSGSAISAFAKYTDSNFLSQVITNASEEPHKPDMVIFSAQSVPATASDSGYRGQVVVDSDFLYICVATNTWKKIALASI